MFRVNRQTDYAVRVVLALSKKPEGTRISTAEIGREMLIPPALLQRIVAGLANGGFIKTQPGRDGGISLAHLPRQITLLQIVEHFEGDLVISACVLKEGDCPFENKCPVSCQWKRLNDLLRDEMSRVTFQQLVEDGIQIESTLMHTASIPLDVISPTGTHSSTNHVPA
ncbi:MAG: Rrf2 family transcriptional regulator [Anaerolineales bacterium]|nr:Rrf2 family transcriptional regulator [Anaerolineales bacterium]